MNTWTGRLSVRVASAVFAVLLISLLAVAQNSGTGERQVSGPADLADKLKRAQRLAPPSDTPIVYDAGVFACIPGQDRIAQEFVAGLVSRIQPDGGALWPVTVFESADSGETVVLNADGAIIGRMASGGGSGTGSSTAALFCMPRLPAAAAHKHEPSRVVMTARLSASQAQNQAWAGDSGPAAGDHGLARPSAPAGFKDYLVVWNSASNVCLGGECGAAAGVSAIDAGYSHGVALHEDGSVTRIGVGSDTAGVEELRFPSAGAMLAAAGGLGDTAVLGFDGKLRHVSGAGELLGMEGDARRVRFLAASDSALLALLNNGTVFSLGTDAGLLPPEGLSGVAEIGAGSRFFGARRHNGSAVVWGDVSVATNIASGVVALSASRRGAHCLALMKDGKVVAWGDGTYGQCLVPEGLANVTAVAAGGYHSVALKRDGSVACWGLIKGAPPLLTNVVAISASYLDVCAITEDGAVAVWGRGCPLGGARLRAKTPGACEILDAKIIDCGIYMAVVRARAGLLEGDADGDGVPAVEEVFLLGTDPQVKDAGAFAVKSTGTDNTEQLSMVAVKPASVKKAAGNPSFALKTSGVTYYVDDTAGDDSNDGLSWDYPKHTIQAAVDLGQAGDTVLVAPGTYCEGTCVTPAGLFNNRLVINNGVVVKSVAGAVATIIQGSGSDYFDTSDAVRCVFITDGALDGFTLQGGAAVAHWTSADQRDKSGGCLNMGVATAESEARNCILDGGIAYDGGGVWGGRLVNCLIRNCNAYYPAGADWSVLLNCTVTANGGWYWSSCGGARSCGVTNSIISGNTGWESPECHCCRVFRSCSDASDFGNGNTAEEVLFADPLFSDAGNGDFTLLSASPCVDAGSDSSVTTSTDLLGNARIQGMAVDMGVYEMNCMDYTLSVVNGVGGGMLPWGATANVAADLSEYYVFAGWQVSPGDAYLGASFDASQPVTEVTMPDCDVTLTAEYRYPILSVNGGCGGGVLMAGETVSVFSDEPPYNYWFTGWQVSPAGTYLGGSFEASQPWTTVTMPGFDVTLTATFVERERTLTVNNGTGGGVFAVGSSVSIAAEVPQFCYFTGWQASVGYGDLGGGFDASQPGTTVTMPDCDVTLTATYMLSDSDGDGTPDIYDAFPQDASGTVDSDGDGMPDFLTGLPGSLEEDMDDDNDDMPDWWEWTYAGFNSLDSSDKYQDFDGDGLLNVEECQLSTDPWLWDSDNDGLSDSWEFMHHYDPATPEIDADADGLPDVWEIKSGSAERTLSTTQTLIRTATASPIGQSSQWTPIRLLRPLRSRRPWVGIS